MAAVTTTRRTALAASALAARPKSTWTLIAPLIRVRRRRLPVAPVRLGRMPQTAVAAAIAVAREQGVRCEDPVVLRDVWHVLVHLRPSAVVARVSSALPYPIGPDPRGVVRELAVAAFCARAGCAVVPPADEVEAVPYEHGG